MFVPLSRATDSVGVVQVGIERGQTVNVFVIGTANRSRVRFP